MSQNELPKIQIGKDGKRMILIPAGEFLRGTSNGDLMEMDLRFRWPPIWFENESPQQSIYLDAYYIGETPVTNADYKRFVDAPQSHIPQGWDENSRAYPMGKENHPVVGISWDDANAYASWVGGRLPTEAEWEKAARGTDGRHYPWGNNFDATRCNSAESNVGDTTPVGRYSPRGDSPYGVKDMAGNAWEWCADWYQAHGYNNSGSSNLNGAEVAQYRVVRGGAFYCSAWYARCAARYWDHPDLWKWVRGMRVVLAPAQL